MLLTSGGCRRSPKKHLSTRHCAHLSTFAILLQFLCNSFAIIVQYFRNSCAVLVQYFCNYCAILVQYFFNHCAILVQYFLDTFAILLQHLCNTPTQYRQPEHTVYNCTEDTGQKMSRLSTEIHFDLCLSHEGNVVGQLCSVPFVVAE